MGSQWTWSWFRSRKYRFLLFGDHRYRSDPVSTAFERFLNPERVSMPDIDVDFCYERRQEVIDYVVRKYGKDQVVQIITFGTMAARAVIRDVGRVLDIPYAKVDGISKMVPNELNITIDKALKISKDLRNAYEQDEETHYLIDMSKRLEGLPRHASMHAAGVVIGKTAIDEYVPLATGADNAAVTQFTMTTIEELGLLKMDFLGLRTLTVIQDAEKMVRRKVPDFDITKIDPTDKEVYEMIGNGHTEGVFQLESSGMKSFMKELKPQNMEDIIAGISLFDRDQWILFHGTLRERIIRKVYIMNVNRWKRFWSQPMDVSFIRNRLCRSL